MGFAEDMYRRYSPLEAALRGDFGEVAKRVTPIRLLSDLTGYSQYQNTVDSNNKQIAYDEYMKGGNLRAYQDWLKNVGSKGRSIRYPELSYPGAMLGYSTGIARAMYNSDTAAANFTGHLPYRTAGLYGVGTRLSRWL